MADPLLFIVTLRSSRGTKKVLTRPDSGGGLLSTAETAVADENALGRALWALEDATLSPDSYDAGLVRQPTHHTDPDPDPEEAT